MTDTQDDSETPSHGTDADYREPERAAELRQVGRNVWEPLLRAYPVELLGEGSPGAGRTAKLIAWHLASYTNPDGTSGHPGVRILTEQTGLKDRAVRKALDSLRRAGLVRRVSRGSNLGTKNAADCYELTRPPRRKLSTTTGTTVPVVTEEPPAPPRQTTGTTVPPTTTRPLHKNPPSPQAGNETGQPVDNPPAAREASAPPLPGPLSRHWSRAGVADDDQLRLWLLLIADPDTKSPSARGKQPGWLAAALSTLRDQDKQQQREAVAELQRTEPPCEHGTPAGQALHPKSGEPLCPLCRDHGRQAAS